MEGHTWLVKTSTIHSQQPFLLWKRIKPIYFSS